VRRFLALALLLSCDWFGLRDPESPGGPPYWEQPTTPDAVLRNLENALNFQLPENYMSSLDEFFVFAADPSLDGPQYENWTRSTEDTVIRNMMAQLDLGQPTPINAALTVIDEWSDGPSSYYYNLSYDITVYTSGGNIYRALGASKLNLVKNPDTKLWDILTWEDFKGDSASWAEVKVLFR